MRGFKTGAIAGTLALGASLLLARIHPFGDAELFTRPAAQGAMLEESEVPPEVRQVLAAKCVDCHSNETRAPFYGRFAPVSWLMERDIVRGRRAMNLSLWSSYSADQQQALTAKIAQETKSHEMPLLQYRVIHWNARITDREELELSQWARRLQGPDGGNAPNASAGDPVRGKEVFGRRCTGCHALAQNREGPKLQGVYGRSAGTIANYPYSTALKNAHMVWDDATLDRWLTDPDTAVPGNNMEFRVSKLQDRRDIISYLKTAAGK